MKRHLFSEIPKVDEILETEAINLLLKKLPKTLIMDSIREELDELREAIKGGHLDKMPSLETIVSDIGSRIESKNRPNLRRVINGTGVVIHTNLGRSLISEELLEDLKIIASNYSNLEYDLKRGQRGLRYDHIEEIIRKITGAERALVVNNNAAAVLLALSALGQEKEVIVSRGELIEIGGSFRIPDVMEAGGVELVAVGTTNKTHLRDYERAITEETSALLKVHTSNYKILGFTSDVSLEELNSLKEKYDLPLIEDLGSGVLVDLSKYGLDYEPTVQDSVSKGVDIVTFSGDKLLGGPQAGIIVGKAKYIEMMESHPLTRAFRPDKLTLFLLEATLRNYLDENKAIEEVPTLRMIFDQVDKIDRRCEIFLDTFKVLAQDHGIVLSKEDGYSEVGGGSLPLEKLPTKLVTLEFIDHDLSKIERCLREIEVPIIGRLHRDKLYLDFRTIREDEIPLILRGFEEIFKII